MMRPKVVSGNRRRASPVCTYMLNDSIAFTVCRCGNSLLRCVHQPDTLYFNTRHRGRHSSAECALACIEIRGEGAAVPGSCFTPCSAPTRHLYTHIHLVLRECSALSIKA